MATALVEDDSEFINYSKIKIVQKLCTYTSDVTCVAFGENSSSLITGSSDKHVRSWQWRPGDGYTEVPQQSPLGHANSHEHGYGVTCVSVRGPLLATSSIDGSTVLWNLKTSNRMHVFMQPGENAVRVCRFSPNNTVLATAGDSGTICLWDLIHHNLVRTITEHDSVVQGLSFSPDGLYLISGCTIGDLNLWSVDQLCDTTLTDTIPWLAVEDAHDLGILSCDFYHDFKTDENDIFTTNYTLATSGNDDNIKIWCLTITKQSKEKVQQKKGTVQVRVIDILWGHSSAVTCVRWSTKYKIIVSASLDKTVRLWKPKQTEEGFVCAKILEGHARYVNCCEFSNDMLFLASGSNDKTTIIWDLTGNTTLDSDIVGPPLLLHYWTNLQENAVARIGSDPENQVQLIHKIDNAHSGAVNSCDFYENSLLASGASDKLVRLYKLNKDSNCFEELEFSPLRGHTYSVNRVAFSSDGKHLVSCSLDGSAIVWNAENRWQTKYHIKSNNLGIRACQISPDNKMLVTAGDDELVTVYDFETIEEITKLEGHAEAITSLSFTTDSKLLASVCNNGELRIWLIDERNITCIYSQCDAHDLGAQDCDFAKNVDAFFTISKPNKLYYLLATCGNDGLVKLWKISIQSPSEDYTDISEMYKVREWCTLRGHGGNVTGVRVSSFGGLVFSVDSSNRARVWDVSSGTTLHALRHDASLTGCAVTEDSTTFVTACIDSSLWLWKMPQRLVFQSILENRLSFKKKLEANSSNLKLKSDDGKIADENNLKSPEEFTCPITQDIMQNPVRCSDGYVYEYQAIAAWLAAGRNTSPMTNEPLANIELTPEINLKQSIKHYIENLQEK